MINRKCDPPAEWFYSRLKPSAPPLPWSSSRTSRFELINVRLSAQNNAEYFIQMGPNMNWPINLSSGSLFVRPHAWQTRTSCSLKSCVLPFTRSTLMNDWGSADQVKTLPPFPSLSSQPPTENTPASIISVVCASVFLPWPLRLLSRSCWQAPIQPTMGQKPPWQTKVLISFIINQYAAGRPSGEDFTDWMHLFSRSTARDGWRDGGENKDISDSCPGCCAGSKWGGRRVDASFFFFLFKKLLLTKGIFLLQSP